MSDRLRPTVVAEGRTSNNYLYTGSSVDELAEALDPKWKGALPFSVLIDQQGRVLYRVEGMIDRDLVVKEVLNAISPYYTPDK